MSKKRLYEVEKCRRKWVVGCNAPKGKAVLKTEREQRLSEKPIEHIKECPFFEVENREYYCFNQKMVI